MNLLDKIWFGLLTIVALTIFSCEDSSDIGLDLDSDGVRVKVLYTELPLEAKNVSIDSIITSDDSRLLLGKNVDPTFGTIRSTLYSQLSFKTGVLIPGTDKSYVIDSTVINLNIDKVHTNEFDQIQHFDIYQLTDTLFGSNNYYANYSTPYRTDKKEGSFDMLLNSDRVRDKDSLTYILSYRLPDDLGDELFAIATEEKGSSISPAGALKYEYKGIAIVPSEDNTILLGIEPEDSTNITVHYHEIHSYKESNVSKDSVSIDSLTLVVGLNSLFYNNISTDRTGSRMENEKGNYNSFSTNDGNVYLQPASGIFPKLDLDTLSKFLARYPDIQINRLEIVAETRENDIYHQNIQDLRFMYVDAEDGSKINTNGLASNILYEAAIMTDNGYLARIPEMLVSSLDETSLTYEGYPTFFGQLVETGSLNVESVIVMPTDLTTPDYSIFDEKSGFRIKLYYTLPD